MVELLVVAAIISLLLCILLPALRNVKESARSATCASNLRQVFLLVNYYQQDLRHHIAAIHWPNNTDDWTDPNTVAVFWWAQLERHRYWTMKNSWGLDCPSIPRKYEFRPYTQAWPWDAWLESNPAIAWKYHGWPRYAFNNHNTAVDLDANNYEERPRPFTSMKEASRWLMLADPANAPEWGPVAVRCHYGLHSSASVGRYHGNKSNAICFDGHVRRAANIQETGDYWKDENGVNVWSIEW